MIDLTRSLATRQNTAVGSGYAHTYGDGEEPTYGFNYGNGWLDGYSMGRGYGLYPHYAVLELRHSIVEAHLDRLT